jgi:hypothetical protein
MSVKDDLIRINALLGGKEKTPRASLCVGAMPKDHKSSDFMWLVETTDAIIQSQIFTNYNKRTALYWLLYTLMKSDGMRFGTVQVLKLCLYCGSHYCIDTGIFTSVMKEGNSGQLIESTGDLERTLKSADTIYGLIQELEMAHTNKQFSKFRLLKHKSLTAYVLYKWKCTYNELRN